MKTILSAILTVALVSVLVGAGTFAYYTDTEMSGDNTFTSGTMDLLLTNGQGNPNARWTFEQGAPGFARDNGYIRLHNVGNLSADHVEIEFILDKYEDNDGDADTGYNAGPESDTDQSGVGTMGAALKVYGMIYSEVLDENDGSSIVLVGFDNNNQYFYDTDYLTNTNPGVNDYIDLDDLADPINSLDDLVAPAPTGTGTLNDDDYTKLYMDIGLVDTGIPQNDFQGDIIHMTVKVTLNQDVSQSHTPEVENDGT